MAGYNRVVLIGNLTRDPEFKQLSSGQAVCRLGIAINRQFKNRQTNELTQEVCYIDVDVWGAQATTCNQYLQKGRSILVEGRLKLDSWQDTEGNGRSKHSVVADRVVFLTSQTTNEAQEEVTTMAEQPQISYQAPAVQPARRTPRKNQGQSSSVIEEGTSSSVESDEISETSAFKDEPPFKDDLPF